MVENEQVTEWEEEVDMEWVKLMVEAKSLGITVQEIKQFLKHATTS